MRVRYRVNTSISTKAIVTWDCTAEVENEVDVSQLTKAGVEDSANQLMQFQLALSDELVAELKKRYPLATDMDKALANG